MKQWRCTVCGYTFEGQNPPEVCPQHKASASKFEEVKEGGNMVWAAKYQVDIARDVDEGIKAGLRTDFEDECFEVGMYLTVSRVVFREDYPGIGEYWRRAALEETDHASHFAEILSEVVTSSTKKSLEMRVAAEFGATQGKADLATLTKKQNLGATHDSAHEMACDEARHGRAFQDPLRKHFDEGK